MCHATALPRCCHGVTRFRTKLQCKAGKNEGRIQEALLRSLVLTWRLTYLWLYQRAIDSTGRVLAQPDGDDGLRLSATTGGQRASTSVVLGNAPRLWLDGKVPTALTGLLAPSTVVPRSRRSPAPWSGYETGRAAQKVSAKSCFVWLWLMLGATDRICEEQTAKQAGQESHVGKSAQSAKCG